MSWRQQIRDARAIVHATMALRCLHVSPDGLTQAATQVRYHYSRGALGQFSGSDGYGERAETFTEVVFDDSTLTLSRGDLLVFESGGVVQVGNVMPGELRTDFRKADVAQFEEPMFARYPFLTPGQPWAGLTFPE